MTTAVATERPPVWEDNLPEDTGIRPYPWTVDSFYRAFERGVFGDGRGLELIEGEIIQKVSPQLNPHAQAIGLTEDAVREAFAKVGVNMRMQSPLDIGARTEPEPDLMVLRGRRRDYDRRKPKPAEILLLVEVADSTLAYDRNRKAAVYAGAGIEDYWVLSLPGRWLEVRRDPVPAQNGTGRGEYRSVSRYAEGESVSPLHAPDARIMVADLLPGSSVDAVDEAKAG